VVEEVVIVRSVVEVLVVGVVNQAEDSVADPKSGIRQRAKRFVPAFVLGARRRWLVSKSVKRVDRELDGKPAADIFSEIYRRQLWGRPDGDRQFSSGHGSSMNVHVQPYVEAVGRFVESLPSKPSVVDLGCGDFNVGSRIRPFFGTYVACDVAQEVLEENRVRYATLDVDFRKVDMIRDDLPSAEVCVVRQVFQHLSNADIARVTGKLHKFRILILTELLPNIDFTPNLDQPTGVASRLARGIRSGVVLTEPPFSLSVMSSQVLCATFDEMTDARLVTTAYWLR